MAETTPPGQTAFLHDVFISYSRKDSAFVSVLEAALRRYKPPKDLLAPQRRLNVFRDVEDFTGTEYGAAVAEHLRASHKLIVICSPQARASQWVDDEIRRFVQTHPPADIIAVIVAGVPNNEAKAGEEAKLAFPQALVEHLAMPLACDYRGFDPKSDKDAAGKKFREEWFKLLADLYGCSRAEIEQRERNRVVRQRVQWASASSGVLTALGAALLFAWHQDKTAKSEQFAAQSMQQADRDPEQALRLARQAVEHRETPLSTSALRVALARAPDLTLALPRPAQGGGADSVEPAAFAFSPDATKLAFAAGKSYTAVTLQQGRVILDNDAAGSEVTDLRFSPNGSWLAAIVKTTDERRATLVSDVASGKTPARIDGALFWRASRDGAQTAVVLQEKSVEVGALDPSGNWRASKKLAPRDYALSAQNDGDVFNEVSPDGRLLATLSVGKNASQLTLTDLDSGKSTRRTLPSPTPNKLLWSPKGAYLVAAALNGVDVVEAHSLKTIFHRGTGNEISVEDVSFSPDEKLLATTNRNGEAILWDIVKNKKFASFAGPPERAWEPTFSPDGAFLSVHYAITNRILLFAVEDAASVEDGDILNKPSMEFSPLWGGAHDATFAPDGKALLIAYKRKLALWNTSRWRWRQRLPLGYDARYEAGVPQGLGDIQFIAQGPAVGVLHADGWRGWSVISGEGVKGKPGPLKPIAEAMLSESDGARLRADAQDETTLYLEDGAGSQKYPLQHKAQVMSKTFSPNGACILTTSRFMAAGGEAPDNADVARLWDTETGALLREWPFGFGNPDSAFFAGPDRIVVLASGKGFVYETPLCETLDSLNKEAKARVATP